MAALGVFLVVGLEPSLALADVGECAGLGTALTEHSCFHAVLGPFNTVLSTVGSTPTSATPNIDAVHTEHRVALAEPAGHNVVTYSPARSGQWIVFLGRDVPIAVFDAKGQAKPALRTDRGTTGCDALPVAHAFEFEAGERYRFVLGPSEEREVVLVVEYVEDFSVTHGRDKDRDGWGDPNDTTDFTVCSAVEGYSERLGDCNDEDPEIHPEAQETCDGVDRNCNGLATDERLQCWTGLGACMSTGRFTCEGVPEGEPVQCGAVPKATSDEQCNGMDDDCNGVIDDGPALCRNPDAPTCVRHGDGAFCGCLVDLDCGDPTSGRVCDTRTRTCKDGCSNVPGGNGCVDGLVCSSETNECVSPDALDPEPEEPEPEPPADSGGGCSCRVGARGQPNEGPRFLLMGLGALLFLSRRRRRKQSSALSSLALLVCGLLLVSCGGKTLTQDDGEPPDEPGQACVPLLAKPPAEHACSHGLHGPYTSVVATLNPDTGPVVDRVHIPYQVEFVEGAEGWLSYRASRDGQHVFFTGSTVELMVIDEDDASDSIQPILVERSDSCEAFTQAQVVQKLSKGIHYRVLIRQLDHLGEPVLFFVEHLGTFGNRAFLRQCE